MAMYVMPCRSSQTVLRYCRTSMAAAVTVMKPPAAVADGSPASPAGASAPPAASAGVPGWATRLRCHLRWVIGIKLLLIYLLFALFFSPSQRPAIDAARVSDRLQLDR